MASSLPKSIKVFFNDLIKTFNNANEMGKIVPKYKMPQTEGEQSSNTVWRPIDDISSSSQGRTISGFTDVTALSVPSSLNSNVADPSDFINSTFKLNANDLNDQTSRDRKLKGVIRKISSDIDQKIKNLAAKQGGIFIKESAALTSYAQLSQCEAEMSIRGIDMMEPRSMFLEPFISNAVANQLQARETINAIPEAALERNRLPMIAGFDTFKGNTMPLIVNNLAANGTNYNTNQVAVQKHIPLGNDSGSPNAKPVDNRFMPLIVDTGTVVVKEGDAFTIADVFGVNMITKESTGKLQTFRVVVGATGAATWTITPALIALDGGTQAEKEYANCTTGAANNKEIVFLNTVDQRASVFFTNDAVEIVHGSLSGLDMEGSGVAVARDTTDSGIELILLRNTDILTLDTRYRLTAWCAANILVPQKCGVILGSQS